MKPIYVIIIVFFFFSCQNSKTKEVEGLNSESTSKQNDSTYHHKTLTKWGGLTLKKTSQNSLTIEAKQNAEFVSTQKNFHFENRKLIIAEYGTASFESEDKVRVIPAHAFAKFDYSKSEKAIPEQFKELQKEGYEILRFLENAKMLENNMFKE